ncbi:MAG: glycosyltransferase family 2 protein [Bacteriovoracaceae bacterium]|nr:glycosyltransferase family 2 protein [Bacteriovoracaceae bacterium]
MQIDIIIPTYNRAHTLERALNSIFHQTYTDFQIYLIDDASTDETALIKEKYINDPRFHYHFLEVSQGVSHARNIGVALGNSQYVSFLDSDDEWLPLKLDEQVKHLTKNPDCQFIHSEEIWIRNGVRVNPKLKHNKNSTDLFQRSLEHCLISPSTVVIKRDLFLSLGGFDTSMTVCEDYDLWLKVLVSRDVIYISSPLINKYGGHADQLSIKFVAMDYWRIKSLFNLLKNKEVCSLQKLKITEVIIKKSKLLLSNYKKYNNQIQFAEIEQLLLAHSIIL